MARQVLPTFLLGLVIVSYFQAFFPEDIISAWMAGTRGVLVAALLGGPLYTPTLIEVVLGKALMDLGMSPAATRAHARLEIERSGAISWAVMPLCADRLHLSGFCSLHSR